eukprot:4337331-Prymnesium_polylepis.2
MPKARWYPYVARGEHRLMHTRHGRCARVSRVWAAHVCGTDVRMPGPVARAARHTTIAVFMVRCPRRRSGV